MRVGGREQEEVEGYVSMTRRFSWCLTFPLARERGEGRRDERRRSRLELAKEMECSQHDLAHYGLSAFLLSILDSFLFFFLVVPNERTKP